MRIAAGRLWLVAGASVVGLVVGVTLYALAMPNAGPGPTLRLPCPDMVVANPGAVAHEVAAGFDPWTGRFVPAEAVCDPDGPGPAAAERRPIDQPGRPGTIPIPVGFALGAGAVLVLDAASRERRRRSLRVRPVGSA